jgi:hypothetical protein
MNFVMFKLLSHLSHPEQRKNTAPENGDNVAASGFHEG